MKKNQKRIKGEGDAVFKRECSTNLQKMRQFHCIHFQEGHFLHLREREQTAPIHQNLKKKKKSMNKLAPPVEGHLQKRKCESHNQKKKISRKISKVLKMFKKKIETGQKNKNEIQN